MRWPAEYCSTMQGHIAPHTTPETAIMFSDVATRVGMCYIAAIVVLTGVMQLVA